MFNIPNLVTSYMAYNFVTNDNLDLDDDIHENNNNDTDLDLIDIEDIEVTEEEEKTFWDAIEDEEEYNERDDTQ